MAADTSPLSRSICTSDIGVLSEVFLRGGENRLFDAVEHDGFLNVFVAMDHLDHTEKFGSVH